MTPREREQTPRERVSKVPNILAKVLIGADDHLCSKNYGGHRDYSAESLSYFQMKTKLLEELGCTHFIGLGDLSFGRITTLEYRLAVERELRKQMELTGGRRWELKGNHDKATYGMTEYEYYVEAGLLRPAENLEIGSVRLNMIDYGKELEREPSGLLGRIIPPTAETVDIILGHNYFCNTDKPFGQYGTKSINLGNMHDWFGVNHVISGHIHDPHVVEAHIESADGARTSLVTLQYPGCMSRPSYHEGICEKCQVVVLTIYDNGEMEYDSRDIDLLPLGESFNFEAKEQAKEVKEEKHIDLSDITERLNAFKVGCGSPEDIINGMTDMDVRYREKALQLLQEA